MNPKEDHRWTSAALAIRVGQPEENTCWSAAELALGLRRITRLIGVGPQRGPVERALPMRARARRAKDNIRDQELLSAEVRMPSPEIL
jgi:hypothetical protein